jgi:hypothetical protein
VRKGELSGGGQLPNPLGENPVCGRNALQQIRIDRHQSVITARIGENPVLPPAQCGRILPGV